MFHIFKPGSSVVASVVNSSRARSRSRFSPVLCALAVFGRIFVLPSSRHISPPEESRRCELPCRDVHILRRSLADNLSFILSFFSLPASNSPERPLAFHTRASHSGRKRCGLICLMTIRLTATIGGRNPDRAGKKDNSRHGSILED